MLPPASPSGPQLKVWRIENSVANTSASQLFAGQSREKGQTGYENPWRLSLRIHAALALQKVLIYDNDRLFRQFTPAPPERIDFARILMGPHDRQHRFVVEARDFKGRRMVSSALTDGDYKPGRFPGNVSHFLYTRQGRESARVHYKLLFGSRDCVIVQNDLTKLSDKDGPTLLADTIARSLTFKPRLNSPEFMLVERETVLKQSIEASDSSSPDLQMFSLGVDITSFTGFAFEQPGGKIISEKRSDSQKAVSNVLLKIGGYAALFADTSSNTSLLNGGSNSSNKLNNGNSSNGPNNLNELQGSANSQTSIGMFPLRSELQTAGGPWQPLLLHMSIRDARMYVGYHLPLQVLPSGMGFRQTFLLMRPFTKDQIKKDQTEIEKTENSFNEVQRAFGLDGRQPAYSATMEAGRIVAQSYPLDLTADDASAVLVDLSKADLPCDLPVRISKLHDNWTAVCAELPANSKSVPFTPGELPQRALGVRNDTGYTSIDLNSRAHRLFLGHPIICDRPDIHINIVDWQRKGLLVELHNPGKEAVTTYVRVHKLLGFGRQTVHILPGSSRILTLSWR